MKKIEIFNEENTISIDDGYYDTDITFYPEDRKFVEKASVKNDCFYITSTYEYKFSLNPIEVSIRLLERCTEPPKEYSVKDGVLLESEINKEHFSPETIDSLKEQIEWRNMDLSGYEIIFYVLQIHAKNEYRRFLRQTKQRFLKGVLKVEDAMKEKEAADFQIFDREYGKHIDCSVNDNEKKEWDKYFKMTEKEQLKSKCGKKLEHLKKFEDVLFNENSSKYVGISRGEFSISSEVLNYIDKLLDEKGEYEDGHDEKKRNWNWLKYIWTIIVNLITTAVLLAIYSKVSNGNSFEIITVSMIALTYLTIRGFSIGAGIATYKNIFYLDAEFKRIRKLLNNEPSKQEETDINTAQKEYKRIMGRTYIEIIFLSILWFISIVNLLMAL